MKTKLTVLLIILANFCYSQEKYRNFITNTNVSEKAEGIALILANNNYGSPKNNLTQAISDGKLMTSALKDAGFEIEVGYDLNQEEMLSAIVAFTNKLSKYKQAVIYYAGHAAQVDGENYIMPSDVKLGNELLFKTSSLNIKTVFNSINNPLIPKVIILDACRTNPMVNKIKMSSKNRDVKGEGLKEVNASKNSMIIFSTTANTIVSDDNPFTEIFSSNIKSGGCIENILKKTRNDILAIDRQQLIWSREALTGDICFGDNPNVTINIDDQDNDGIADEFDECPSRSGLISNYGCPISKVYKKSRFLFSKNNVLGYADQYGSEIVAPKYDVAWPFSENIAVVVLNGEWQYINQHGEKITRQPYDSLSVFKNGVGVVKLNNKYGLIDSLGQKVTETTFDKILQSETEERLIFAKKTGDYLKWGMMNTEGEILLIPTMENAFDFSEGIAASKRNGRFSFFNSNGEILFSDNYEDTHPFTEGRAGVKKNGKWGFIDRTGTLIKNYTYTNIGPFVRGHALATSGNIYYVIDKYGKVSFNSTISVCPGSDGDFYINASSAYKVDTKLNVLEENLDLVSIWSLYDRDDLFKYLEKYDIQIKKGNGTLNYFNVLDNDKAFFKIYRKHKKGYVDNNGNDIIPIEHAKIEFKNGLFIGFTGDYDSFNNPLKDNFVIYNQEGEILKKIDNIKEVKIWELGSNERKDTESFWAEDSSSGLEMYNELGINISSKLKTKGYLPYRLETEMYVKSIGIKKNGLVGTASFSGEVILEPQFDNIETILVNKRYADVRHLEAEYKKEEARKKLDDKNNYIFTNFLVVSKNNMLGVVSKSGEQILPLAFEKITFMTSWYKLNDIEEGKIKIRVVLDGKEFDVDFNGNCHKIYDRLPAKKILEKYNLKKAVD